MAIAIRGTTPGTGTDNGGSASVSVTLNGARQPQAGDLLLIFHCNDYYAYSNMATPTVDGSTTGVTAVTGGSFDDGNLRGHIKTYYWVNSSTGDRTVSTTETGSHDEEKGLTVYVLSGADTSSPVDASSGTGHGTTGDNHNWVVPAVSPSSSDAYLIGHVCTGTGNSGGGAVTPPGSMAESHDVNVGGLTFEGAVQQLSASGSTGTRTWVPAGDAPWAGVLVAVKTGSSATDATVTPAVVAAVAALSAATVKTGETVSALAVAAAAAVSAPTVQVGATVAAVAVATAAAVSAPTVQTGETVAAVAVATVTALPAPTVSTAGNATVNATVVTTVAALPSSALQTGETVSAVAVSAAAAVSAPTVSVPTSATVAATVVATSAAVLSVSVETVEASAGGWASLQRVVWEAHYLAVEEAQRIPSACPEDGTLLQESDGGVLWCPFDGWQYQR